MRKAMPYLGAALSVLAMAWSTPSKAQEPFKDVPQDHWAYQAVTDLQQKKILLGYPDGYFRGKRTLTRYEFAVALERALQNLPVQGAGQVGPQGPAGPQGDAGPAGPEGPPGMTPDEVANLRRLTDEFKNELAALGDNVKAINSRLDALSRDVADIRDQLNRMIHFSGDAFFGFRSDLSRYDFNDYSGAPRAASKSHFSNVDAPHDFHLVARDNLSGGVKFTGDIVVSNYLSYRAAAAGIGDAVSLGGPSAANKNGGPEQVSLYQAKLDIPIGQVGSGTVLTLGRFKHSVTPLTYYRPDTDAYFDLPWYDDGNWIQDGFRIQSKFGSATTSLWAGSFGNTTTTTAGLNLNRPLIGATVGPLPSVVGGGFPYGKPTGFNPLINNGAIEAQQVAGVHIGVPLARIGELGVTAIDLSESGANTFGPTIGGPAYHNVVVYGADVKLNPLFGRFVISGEAAKSVTQYDFSTADGSNNDDNNAYLLNVGYNSGALNATAGYQYYDPRFSAPGYWNKIGNWYNPTNVQGPFLRLGYGFSKDIQLYIGGDYLGGARNRPGFTMGSNIGRATAGVKYNLNKMVNLSANYEGVFYDLSSAISASGVRSSPVEQYITFGAGLNLTGNTVLKLAYQLINYQDVGSGFSPTNQTSNASVFTTQVAVHF